MEKDCDPCSSHNTESVLWTITGRCNFRCRFCCVNTPDAAMDELTHEEAIQRVNRSATFFRAIMRYCGKNITDDELVKYVK